ncbi:MAG: DUF3473 domain-containing protein [Candidatus Eisenbacteria bacterium]|nr:DUF3473 domain-containing protein [Candidatus Eisenbacteria bacterium]
MAAEREPVGQCRRSAHGRAGRFREDIRRARFLLQDLSGQEVTGYQMPSYAIMARTMWALQILFEEGHRYDSSNFPIARRRYGIPRAERWPHRLDLGEGRSLAEFPLQTFRAGFLNVPATGGAYLRLPPFGLQAWSVQRMLAAGKPFVLSIHPWELDPEQPRFAVGGRTRWTHYHNLSRASDRLARLLAMGSYRPLSGILLDLGLL